MQEKSLIFRWQAATVSAAEPIFVTQGQANPGTTAPSQFSSHTPPVTFIVPIEYPKDLVHSLTANWACFGFWHFPISVFHSRNILPSGVVTDLFSLPFSSFHQFHDGGDHSWSMVETTLERDSPQYGFFHRLMWRHDPIRAILQQSPEPFNSFYTKSISREGLKKLNFLMALAPPPSLNGTIKFPSIFLQNNTKRKLKICQNILFSLCFMS